MSARSSGRAKSWCSFASLRLRQRGRRCLSGIVGYRIVRPRQKMQKLIREGIGLSYEEAGEGDPPLLLVHCWCCDHTFLAPQFEHFSRRHRVVTVDLRDHGESDKPEPPYTVAGFC